MKKSRAWLINIGLLVVGSLLVVMFFSMNREQVSQSQRIIEQLNQGEIEEAFRTIQQVNLDSSEINGIKDVLLLQTLDAVDMWNEEQLLLLQAFVNNAPVTWGSSFHMPILSNITIYLDYIDATILLECHEPNHEIIVQLREHTANFTNSILPYFRNGLVQALNNARNHYNNALALQDMLATCYATLDYFAVLESGLTFMNATLNNPSLSNFNNYRAIFRQAEDKYDIELATQQNSIEIIMSRKETLRNHTQRHQTQINAIGRR